MASLGPETLASEVDWWVALAFEFWRWLEVPACPAWSVAGADGCCWVTFAGQQLVSIVDFFGLFQGLREADMVNDSRILYKSPLNREEGPVGPS